MFGGVVGIDRRLRGTLLFGNPLLLEGFFRLLPGAKLGSRLIKGKAHRQGDLRGDQDQKNQALSPDIATTFFIAEFIEMSQGLGGFGSFVVGIVKNQAALAKAIMA